MVKKRVWVLAVEVLLVVTVSAVKREFALFTILVAPTPKAGIWLTVLSVYALQGHDCPLLGREDLTGR